jgi:uncharacterized phage protein (TIGR02216 family)
MMRAGMCGLGIRPTEFWDLTPAELLLLLGLEDGGVRAFDRDNLAQLSALYPDTSRMSVD